MLSANRASAVTAPQGNTGLAALVDATFAFAVTLLVISAGRIADSARFLLLALRALPSFAANFAMVTLFWLAHVNWSRRYRRNPAPSLLLSLLLVLLVVLVVLVLEYVYPLRLLFGMFFSWASGGWLPLPLDGALGAGDIVPMDMVYGVAFISMSGGMAALHAHAWRQRGKMAMSGEAAAIAAGETATCVFLVLAGLLSLLIALLLPAKPQAWMVGLPGSVYFMLCFKGLDDALGRRWACRGGVRVPHVD